jgi:hypothetical protein
MYRCVGAYNLSSTVGADAPRISMGAKTAPDKTVDKAPGPGKIFDFMQQSNALVWCGVVLHCLFYQSELHSPICIALYSFQCAVLYYCILSYHFASFHIISYHFMSGSYAPPTYIGTGPRSSMGGRHDLKLLDNFPGPGAYSGSSGGNSVSYTMRPKTSVPASTATIPGPGNKCMQYTGTALPALPYVVECDVLFAYLIVCFMFRCV